MDSYFHPSPYTSPNISTNRVSKKYEKGNFYINEINIVFMVKSIKKKIKKYYIVIVASISLFQGSLKHLLPSHNQLPNNGSIHSRTLITKHYPVIFVDDKQSVPTIKEVKHLLKDIVNTEQLLLDELDKAIEFKNDYENFKHKNNLDDDDTRKMTKLQLSLYSNYQKKFVNKTLELQKYHDEYKSQKRELDNLVHKMPKNYKKLLSTSLDDMKYNSRAEYSEDFSMILEYEIELLQNKLSDEVT